MKPTKIDQSACESLGVCVNEIEKNTNAELVIVVQGRSGQYAHADFLFGFLLAFAGLLFLLFSPFEFQHYWVAIDVALLFAAGSYLSSKTRFIRRLLTTEKFRGEAARARAAALFYETGIANTSAELGVLIFLSLFERRLELIADRGVLKAVPALEWNECMFELHEAGRRPEFTTVLAALNNLGGVLAKHLPATGENPNELPDLPRFDLK